MHSLNKRIQREPPPSRFNWVGYFFGQKSFLVTDRRILSESAMPSTTKHIENPQYLHLEIFGKWTQENVRQLISLLSSHLSTEHEGRVLIDTREQDRTTSTLADYNEAREIAANILGRSMRVAILAKLTHDQRALFFETVARNRGAELRVFNTLQRAVLWLMEDKKSHSGNTDTT